MKKEGKILLTDINADRDRENSLCKYLKLLSSAFYNYSTIRMSLNLFTFYEMSEDINLDQREEMEGYIDTVDAALRCIYKEKSDVDKDIIDAVTEARDVITSKMKILTAYTDTLEIYEYILNRREPDILGTTEDVDSDQLANNMYEFVFSENDKMLVNTRIQEFIAQLPVRMTKDRFYDIISNSLSIYRGGEQRAVEDFVQTIRDSALMDKPEGYDTVYPELNKIIKEFENADYTKLSKEEFDRLMDMISEATYIIQDYVTGYLMLTEIINDVLIVLYTYKYIDSSYLNDKYEVSAKIIADLSSADDIYQASEAFDDMFVKLEGAQEEAYEELAFLNSNSDELYGTYYEMYENQEIKDMFDILKKTDTLTSTSLFMDIDDSAISVVSEEADDIFITEIKKDLIDDMNEMFANTHKLKKRSIMAKVLSQMPVFFNTQQEILEYFQYALSSCKDKAELTACRDLVGDIISGN